MPISDRGARSSARRDIFREVGGHSDHAQIATDADEFHPVLRHGCRIRYVLGSSENTARLRGPNMSPKTAESRTVLVMRKQG